MAKASAPIKISLKDERLAIDQIDQYRLSFFIGDLDIQLAIKDIKTNRLLLFEHHANENQLEVAQLLQKIHEEHTLISAGFWKEIQVFVKNNKFALVPGPLFDKDKLYEYVRLNEDSNRQEDTFHFKQLDQYGLSLAFGYQQEIKAWFKEKYPQINLKFSHEGVAFLKHIQNQLKTNAPAALYLDIKEQRALIAGVNFQKLALYNQFLFKNAEHLIKLTALSCQQFSQDRAKTPLILSGQKTSVEILSHSLKKYFPSIEEGKRPLDLQIHPVFNELESYEYTEILANL